MLAEAHFIVSAVWRSCTFIISPLLLKYFAKTDCIPCLGALWRDGCGAKMAAGAGRPRGWGEGWEKEAGKQNFDAQLWGLLQNCGRFVSLPLGGSKGASNSPRAAPRALFKALETRSGDFAGKKQASRNQPTNQTPQTRKSEKNPSSRLFENTEILLIEGSAAPSLR